MSRQHQDPNRQSGHYQTSYPYQPQQHGQYLQPLPNTYDDRPPSHHAHPSHPEGQHPPSGQGYGSHSPYAGNIAFPNPQHGGSASHQQAYIAPPQTEPNLTVPTHHQHGRRGSPGHSPVTGSSSSSSRQLYSGAGSDTVGGFYPPQPGVQPHHGGDYYATTTQHQDLNAAGHRDEGAQGSNPWSLGPGHPPVGGPKRPQGGNPVGYDGEQGSRPKAPPYRPAVGDSRSQAVCRYPRCNYPVFLDTRVNEYREWCSDQHMQLSITYGVEKPCKNCAVWPRRNGFKYCSGNVCRYPRA